jgi:predicted site-specific integrase-resolvase
MSTVSSVDALVSEFAGLYPPLITVVQAAEIAQVPRATIHAWSSAGRFDEFKIRCGRYIRLHRDAFVRHLISEE